MIRHAAASDIGACLDVIEKANRLSPHYSSFDRSIAESNLRLRLLNPYSLVLINERNDGVLVGVAGAPLYSSSLRVGNEFLYAESEGLALIRGYLRWAKAWGDVEINFCTSFGGELGNRAERLLQRLGLTPIGQQFRVI